MGQSYDDNAVYIGWSNLFDFSTVNTLLASKSLPIPKLILIEYNDLGISLDSEINELFLLTDENINLVGEESNKVKALTLLSSIIRSAEASKGLIFYSNINDSKFKTLLEVLNNHEFYHIPSNIAESAFKNVASANIYAVAHDIRNRDLAYTAISMKILLRAAEKSPKGNTAGRLNMFNPLTKYIMLHQNLVGKNVISIAANGEKVWFNAYYYWHLLLKNGNEVERQGLKFRLTLDRIDGRATRDPISKTVTHLPDLNIIDNKIRTILISEFSATSESMEYKYVDLLISLLLSAATDNAKELILAKINSGTNFARMYVYAMMTGFNIDDIVAFMTSPVAEFIDLMSTSNIFLNESIGNNATSAINMANGIIGVNKFLHGSISVSNEDLNTGELYSTNYPKNKYVFKLLLNIDLSLYQSMKNEAQLNEEEDFTGLGLTMLSLINTTVKNPKYRNLDIRELVNSSDSEVNSYLEYCLNIVEKLRALYDKYRSNLDFNADIKEFRKLYELSSEISVISSAWLGLNQGLPTDELSLLKRMVGMSKIVSNREQIFGIKELELYLKSSANTSIDEEEDSLWEDINLSNKKGSRNIEKLESNKLKLISKLLENNPTLTNIEERLDAAHDAGIINNFNIVEYLKNSEYKLLVKDYYGLIMGTLNVFDMMEVIPHYKQIIECFKALIVSKDAMASKSRLINRLLATNDTISVSDSQLNGIIKYVDKLNVVTFAKGLTPISIKNTIEGFNPYFQNITTNKIELDTLEGLATFKHWVENEFKSWMLEESKKSTSKLYNNGAIKHLTIIPDNESTLLSMDVDLLNPNVTTVSREGYDEILRGMADLEKVQYDSDYTVVDILQLYNLVVNNNKYGGERLTTAFKVCTSPKNILNQYLNNISLLDYDINTLLEYDYIDYLINAAPIINFSAERFHSEKFVKVNDSVRGYILKKLDRDNQYREYNIIPPVVELETMEDKLRRLENFSINSAIEMPHSHNSQHLIKVVDFEGDYTNMSKADQTTLKQNIDNLIKQYSTSNKLTIFKDCY